MKYPRMRITKEEKKLIKKSLKQENPWTPRPDPEKKSTANIDVDINEFKKRIKSHHLENQINRCCYCKTQLTSRTIETDREHIIPKGKMKSLTYHISNLSVACKTCNMSIKNNSTRHISGWKRNGKLKYPNILDPRNYLIVHPNIHNWHDHLDLVSEESAVHSMRIYAPITRIGRITYELFQLSALEHHNNTRMQSENSQARPLHPGILRAKNATNPAKKP